MDDDHHALLALFENESCWTVDTFREDGRVGEETEREIERGGVGGRERERDGPSNSLV